MPAYASSGKRANAGKIAPVIKAAAELPVTSRMKPAKRGSRPIGMKKVSQTQPYQAVAQEATEPCPVEQQLAPQWVR